MTRKRHGLRAAHVGLMPTRLCAAAGFWMLPPVSSPTPHTAKPAATAVAVPLLLPPGTSARFTALNVGPSHEELAFVPLVEKMGMFVLPRRTAPASSSACAAAGASVQCYQHCVLTASGACAWTRRLCLPPRAIRW